MISFSREAALVEAPALDLVIQLCNTLKDEEVDYCHWKSNVALDRSASGENDLDLLVSRIDAQRFTEILYRLGFKEVLVSGEHRVPGVRDYYGHDSKTGRLTHVHVHFQLILGSDLFKNYRLPLEKVYLASAVQKDLFRVPAPEVEFVVFVIRMILKHSTYDSVILRHGNLSSSERHELDYLRSSDTMNRTKTILQYVPELSDDLFDKCFQVLQPDYSLGTKIRVGAQLQRVLLASARYPQLVDIVMKFTRRLWGIIQKHVLGYKSKNQFASGGLLIAVVGGDGSGKTTMIDELFLWLSGKFQVTRLHMGKPDWSWLTVVIRGVLKIGTLLHLYPFEGERPEEMYQPHGLPWFIRAVCTARDRYLTYVRARRASSNGGMVLCDRFSLPGFMAMDGPQCKQAIASLEKANWLHHFLANLENSYYEQIRSPDLLIVLKVKPDLAVQRKRNESEASIRSRCAEVQSLDWAKKSAFVIDASLQMEEVVSQARDLVWAHL